MPLFRRRREESIAFDPAAEQPAVRRSICTGEMTVGFLDKKTGKFRDIMMVEGQRGLEDFCRKINVKVEDVQTIY